jgi:hypothetical protein
VASVSDFLESEATAKIIIGKHRETGEEGFIAATYDPNMITPFTDKRMRALLDDGNTLAAGQMVCEVVKRWDLEGPVVGHRAIDVDIDGVTKSVLEPYDVVADGRPVPLDPDVVQHLPHKLILKVWQGVYEDAMVDPTKETASRRR